MKNFYDLPDTSTLNVSVELGIELGQDSKYPDVFVSINDSVLHNNQVTSQLHISHDIDVNSPLAISIALSNVEYQSSNTKVIINRIAVDDKEVMPRYNYLANYINDRNINTPTSILEFNGMWMLDTKMPFLWWLHDVSGKGWLLIP